MADKRSGLPEFDKDYDGDGVPYGDESAEEQERIINKYFKADPDSGVQLSDIAGLGDEAKKLLANPVKYISNTVLGNFIRPLFTAIFRAGALLVGVIALIFLGSDCQLGQTGETCNVPVLKNLSIFDGEASYLGIADIPIWLGEQLISVASPVGGSLLAPIQSINTQIGLSLMGLGLPAPAIIGAIQVAEIAAGLYLVSIVAETLVGYIAPGLADQVGRISTAPVRWIR